MGFNVNPYRHMEIVAAPEPADDQPRRLALVMLGYPPDSQAAVSVEAMERARKALAAGYTPPERVPQLPAAWVWYCDNCGGKGREASNSLPKLAADWVAHLIASHNASPSDFKGWSEV